MATPKTQQQSSYQQQNYDLPQYAPSASLTTPNNGDPLQAQSDETTSLLLLILSFFFGHLVLWIIIYLLYRNSPSSKARFYAKIAGLLTALFFLPFILCIIFIIIAVVLRVMAAVNRI